MVRHECVAKLVARNRHRQQLRDTVAKEWLFQNLAHARSLLRLLNQHFCYDALQVLAIGVGNSWVVSSQNFQHEALHGVCVESMPQCNHLI